MGSKRRTRRKSRGLILSEEPDQVRLRELRDLLDDRRDAIADLDLEIETLRTNLANFETAYHNRLSYEHATLRRTEVYLRHFYRWLEFLASDPLDDIGSQSERIERKRSNELRRAPSRQARTPLEAMRQPSDTPSPTTSDQSRAKNELKIAYRSLARRFHPDLARTEEERLQATKMMVRVNTLYREADLDRLRAIAEQVKGGEIEDVELTVVEQISHLEERRTWFDSVLENLREERRELEQSPTCELMRDIEQAAEMNVDLLNEIQSELRERIKESYSAFREAIQRLENEAMSYNRKRTHRPEDTLAHRSQHALEKRFDPFTDKSLVRAGLAEIATRRISDTAGALAKEFEAMESDRSQQLSLVLLTYVSELTPFPLKGLATFGDLETRYIALNPSTPRPALAESLVELDEILQFGVKKATAKIAHLGLSFRSDTHRESLLLALKALPVRSALRRVLEVIGEQGQCDGCGRTVFFLPLFRTRGLDNLRAMVCPKCGHSQSKYWLPKGEDVQSVLNPSYLELGLLTEWSFTIADQSIATQLAAVESENMKVGTLKRRFVQDVLHRHEIEVPRGKVELKIGDTRISENKPIEELESQTLDVVFSKDTEWTERDAVALIRHRVRNRFRHE